MKKFLFLALMACAFIACEKQLIGKLPNKQTFTTDSITYSYYVTDLDGNLRKTYKQNEKICIHLDIENNTQDTLYLENMGGNFWKCSSGVPYYIRIDLFDVSAIKRYFYPLNINSEIKIKKL